MKGQPTLLDFFAPIISQTLAIAEELKARGEYGRDAADLYNDFLDQIKRAKDDAILAGKREKDIDECTFAVVAWIDEMFAPHRPWYDSAIPLQISLFSTANAGNEFFDHLKALVSQQEEVREVYFVMLGLGFVGELYIDTSSSSELVRLKDLHARQLQQTPAVLATLAQEYVTPQPYQTKDPGAYRPPKAYGLWIMLALLAVFLLAAAGAAVWWFFLREKPIDLDKIRQDLNQVIAGFECADLEGVLSDDRQITVAGYVQSVDDMQRLQTQLEAIENVVGVSSSVVVYSWPYCEAIAIMQEHTALGADRPGGPRIEPDNHDLSYVEGEFLLMRATATPLYSGYIYVDYYQRNGTVVHMIPTDWLPDNQVGGGESILLGEPAPEGAGIFKRVYNINPPFGSEMIAVISLPEPMYDGLRPEGENAKDYFPVLRAKLQELQAAGGNKPAVSAYVFITTRAAEQQDQPQQ